MSWTPRNTPSREPDDCGRTASIVIFRRRFIAASQIANNPLPAVLNLPLSFPDWENFDTYVTQFESELKGLMPKFMYAPIANFTYVSSTFIDHVTFVTDS